ncbi:leishmanolysin-related zinc metalloendopeptidase [Palleronia caenipelagi]|uniref:Leishmanolysin n=1 Tax=Palleronia caenipelagi TaxID=2489174 RepID=A0A547Q8B3_9RHOB|nr:leishmanolysin-related zinc metalloendopeptidase [Palleronia caenipelagi]TRD22622.1 hypothetical protein FEV53_04185 [Palleronia caenipelagi]
MYLGFLKLRLQDILRGKLPDFHPLPDDNPIAEFDKAQDSLTLTDTTGPLRIIETIERDFSYALFEELQGTDFDQVPGREKQDYASANEKALSSIDKIVGVTIKKAGHWKGSGDDNDEDGGRLTSYTSGGAAAESFNVKVVFDGSYWTSALQQDFIAAAETVSQLILGDVPDVRSRSQEIDDILIYAAIVEIDGPGGVLGRAGPTGHRDTSKLPTKATMRFDLSDAEALDVRGQFGSVVLHEMLHSLGFGSAWNQMGLTSDLNGDLRFTGAFATEMYMDEYAEIALNDPLSAFGVPIEMDGGSGTAGSHWDDLVFNSELMSGYLDGDNANDLSKMTVAALEDMGYDTYLDNPFNPLDLFSDYVMA